VSDVWQVDEREVREDGPSTWSISSVPIFKPSKYHDDYQERVMAMIEKKAKGEEIVTQPAVAERPPHRVVNMMAALRGELGGGSEGEERKEKKRAGAPRSAMKRRRRKESRREMRIPKSETRKPE